MTLQCQYALPSFLPPLFFPKNRILFFSSYYSLFHHLYPYSCAVLVPFSAHYYPYWACSGVSCYSMRWSLPHFDSVSHRSVHSKPVLVSQSFSTESFLSCSFSWHFLWAMLSRGRFSLKLLTMFIRSLLFHFTFSPNTFPALLFI